MILSKTQEVLLGVMLLAIAIGLLLLLVRFTKWWIPLVKPKPAHARSAVESTEPMADSPCDDVIISIEIHGDWIWNFYSEPQARYTVTVVQIGESNMLAHKTLNRSVPRPGGNGIAIGGQGTIQAQLNNNGVPISLPTGSSWQWSDDDVQSQITLDPTDPTGGTIFITVPANDTSTSLTVTASTTDPNGAAVSGSLVVPLTPGVNMFTVVVTQIA